MSDVPFYKSVVAGGTAGVIEILIMYPTDVVKTRAQLSTKSTTMMQMFRAIYAKEGLAGMYRGILSPIVAEAPKRATKFASNNMFKKMLAPADGSQLSSARAGLAGALAGTTEAFINCPFETVKVRMQAKENLNRYRNTADCLRQTLQHEGLAALYRGIEAQVWRNAAWNGTYFACIGTVRNWFPSKPEDPQSQVLFKRFLSGLIGGMAGTLMNTPLDVVKSRMQNQIGSSSIKYRYVLPSLVTIYREEGFRSMYRGLSARALRLGPGGGIMIVAYEVMVQLMS